VTSAVVAVLISASTFMPSITTASVFVPPTSMPIRARRFAGLGEALVVRVSVVAGTVTWYIP
jgi:hypothetical protein